ncbi:hypothetical protein A2454_01075 [Candidatus Peribacteria bacterium RIFOXYC2_FULL_55_14]|nr:MAG: hypothetical protein UY90_C0007G0019 [Candidatus Peregrinibacteria bacterium GW2011_GWA2_54_9]OGJ71711.1 MAG: hypothetical protein A2198_00080 [Candidatus Peribacteria bacterium RIFOXYA1_FULL_56_14]OGJ73322.1 MAG: hypothetical protein A2217_01265 [Candidatus Peribacteria bacterium RIFOXYA2_FULL_55_28]OGJ74504.1 MAG: hypothetical protein A2384_02555 [Candidatus Peribacteria bacterium RIFOXYB1_FULL_54_35]OGJ77550.1 MAG: hypothetical protein A2327_04905 [Candidatus Peribacteria bacterium R
MQDTAIPACSFVLLAAHTEGERRGILKLFLLSAAVLLAAACTAQAQYIEEKFADPKLSNWSFHLPHQYGNVGRLVTEKDGGQLVLGNRAYAFLRREFPGAFTVRFQWQWEDMGGGVAYADHLCILLRATGSVSEKRPFLPEDGIYIVLDAGYGTLNIHKVAGGKVERLVEEKRIRLEQDEKKPAIPAGKWHKVEVVGDVTAVTVSIAGQTLTAKFEEKDVKGGLVGISNREAVGPPGPHRSRLRSLEAFVP